MWGKRCVREGNHRGGERAISQAPPGSRLGKLPKDTKSQGALVTDSQLFFWFLVLLSLDKNLL